MLFACTGLIGCSDSNDEPEMAKDEFFNELKVTNLQALSDADYSDSDSTRITFTWEENILYVNVDKFVAQKSYPEGVKAKGSLQIWHVFAGQISISIYQELFDKEDVDISPRGELFTMKGFFQLPGWTNLKFLKLPVIIGYQLIHHGIDAATLPVYSMNELTIAKGESITLTTPLVTHGLSY